MCQTKCTHQCLDCAVDFFSYILRTWHIRDYKATLGKTSPPETGFDEAACSTDIFGTKSPLPTNFGTKIIFANGELPHPSPVKCIIN